MGLRQSFGLFLEPVASTHGWGYSVFGLAVALQNVTWGFLAPVAGAIADRYGSLRVITVGGLLYAGGVFLTALAASPVAFTAGAGLFIGLGASACGFPLVLAVVGRLVSEKHRGLALGITTAGASLGQLALPFVIQFLVSIFTLTNALLALAALMAALVPLAYLLCRKDVVAGRAAAHELTLSQAVGEAGRHRDYWFLNAGFFVCGFHVAFVGTHLPAYLSGQGLSGMAGAAALAMIGLFNVAGTFTFGALGDRFSKKILLAWLYLARALVILAFVLAPVNLYTMFAFTAGIGLLWLGTIPLTSSLVSHIYGPRYVATLFGVVTMSHQIGAGLGAWLGGYVFDITGTYDIVWFTAIALGVLSAALHLPIREHSLRRAQA